MSVDKNRTVVGDVQQRNLGWPWAKAYVPVAQSSVAGAEIAPRTEGERYTPDEKRPPTEGNVLIGARRKTQSLRRVQPRRAKCYLFVTYFFGREIET